MRSTRRAARRIVLVGTIVLVAAAAGGRGVYVALSGEHASKPGSKATSESSPVPQPPAPDDDPTVVTAPAPDTAAITTPPDGISCPSSWYYFDNPVMHYGLCYPPGWGFTDFSQPEPMTVVPGKKLESLHLASKEAFPWSPGRSSFDAIREDGMIDLELDLLPANARPSSECEPSKTTIVDDLTLLSCEETYDDLGSSDPAGSIRALKVVVPLRRTPLQTQPEADRAGARLLVIARAAVVSYSRVTDLLWQLAKTVRPY